MAFIGIYVTHISREEAEKVANHLLEKRFVACVNFFPIENAYWWKGKIVRSNEVVTLLKTRSDNWEKVMQEIKAIHSYTTPCVIRLEMTANEDYEAWIRAETQ